MGADKETGPANSSDGPEATTHHPAAARAMATWETVSGAPQDISPCSWAYAAAAVRDGTSNFVKMLLR